MENVFVVALLIAIVPMVFVLSAKRMRAEGRLLRAVRKAITGR
jgi:hypothetical protein